MYLSRTTEGRLILMISNDFSAEPRFQITDDVKSQVAAGVNIYEKSGSTSVSFPVKDQVLYPIQQWDELPEGEYQVQAMINRYETFNLSTGHAVQLPPDMGEGYWNTQALQHMPTHEDSIKGVPTELNLMLDQYLPPLSEPKNTQWVRHIKMKSEKLSKFWGRDVILGAHVLLPRDWDKETDRNYPLMIYHGHFPSDFGGFRTEPVPANMDTSDYQQSISYLRLQKNTTGRSLPILSTMDPRYFSQIYHHRNSTPHTLLRRLLCRQLCVSGAVRRCHHL